MLDWHVPNTGVCYPLEIKLLLLLSLLLLLHNTRFPLFEVYVC